MDDEEGMDDLPFRPALTLERFCERTSCPRLEYR